MVAELPWGRQCTLRFSTGSLTKSLSADVINKHMDKLMVEFEGGRASKAPTLAVSTWHRRDRDTTTMKMTGSTGPEWGSVIERITIDMADGKVLAREDTQGKSKRWLKRGLQNAEQPDKQDENPIRRDVLTVLRYRQLPTNKTDHPGFGDQGCNVPERKQEISSHCESVEPLEAEHPRA